jgi:hypothetical protein
MIYLPLLMLPLPQRMLVWQQPWQPSTRRRITPTLLLWACGTPPTLMYWLLVLCWQWHAVVVPR